MTNYGLGRVPEFDERSRQYPLRALTTEAPLVKKTWRTPLALDQGTTSECTGYSGWRMLNTQPQTATIPYDTRRRFSPTEIYYGARTVDQWPGEDYDGSSVIGAAKWLKAQGSISEYRWCFGINDVLQALSYVGPVCLGTTWYNSMFNQVDIDPGRAPYPMTVDVNSGPAGGHAYTAHGIAPGREMIICTNSWGPAWGDEGRFYLKFSDLDMLLKDYGEAVVYVP